MPNDYSAEEIIGIRKKIEAAATKYNRAQGAVESVSADIKSMGFATAAELKQAIADQTAELLLLEQEKAAKLEEFKNDYASFLV